MNMQSKTVINLRTWHIIAHIAGIIFLTGGAYYQVNEASKNAKENTNKIQRLEISVVETKTYLKGMAVDLGEIKTLLRRTSPYERK